MLVPIIVFLLVLGVVLGAYYGVIQRPEDDARDAIQRRLAGQGAKKPGKRVSLLRGGKDITAFPLFDMLARRLPKLHSSLATKIQHAGMQLTVGALLLLCMVSALLAVLMVSMVLVNTWVMLGAAAVAAMIPVWFVGFKASRRIIKFEEQFPEAIDLVSRAMRAGHAFTTALSMVAEEAPQPVAGEYRRLYDEQNFGKPLPDAMRDFADRIPLLDAKFFVTAVLTQRETGGNLSEVLDNLARVIRERFKVKRQIRVISAHGRITGAVLVALPPVMALFFMATVPDHFSNLTNDPAGHMMIAAGLTLQVVGSLLIKKLINIEY
jgi:tight adherence protein B